MTTCSADALAAGEPLAGTAPEARAWIVIEQPGPWGRDALTTSHLDPGLVDYLDGAKAAGVSVLLARHPDRQRARSSGRHVWVARTVLGETLLRHAELEDLSALKDWDLSALGDGQLPALRAISAEPILFVCTQSGRDLCCAVQGRAFLDELLSLAPAPQRARVWECSHIGGHRFSPVALALPSGAVHGRMSLDQAGALLAATAHDRVIVDNLRGHSGLDSPAQAAVIAVLRSTGLSSIEDLVVDAPQPDARADSVVVHVRHHDGRAWQVPLERRRLHRDRLESCGKDPVPGIVWTPTPPC